MAAPQKRQQIFIFGDFSEGAPVDPTRLTPVNTWVPITIPLDDATVLHFAVPEQYDVAITIQLGTQNGKVYYQAGGFAPDSIAGCPLPDLIVKGNSVPLRGLGIYSTGRCTVSLVAE